MRKQRLEEVWIVKREAGEEQHLKEKTGGEVQALKRLNAGHDVNPSAPSGPPTTMNRGQL